MADVVAFLAFLAVGPFLVPCLGIVVCYAVVYDRNKARQVLPRAVLVGALNFLSWVFSFRYGVLVFGGVAMGIFMAPVLLFFWWFCVFGAARRKAAVVFSFVAFFALMVAVSGFWPSAELYLESENKVNHIATLGRYELWSRDSDKIVFLRDAKLQGEQELFNDILAYEYRDGDLFVLTAKYQAKLDTQTNKLYAHYYVNVDEDHAERMRSLYKAGFTLVEQEDEFTAEEQAAFARLKAAYE